MVSTYRNDEDFLRVQLDEVLEERRREVAAIDRTARTILARRTGRAWAGAAGIAGGLFLLGSAYESAPSGQFSSLWAIGEGEMSGHLTHLLLGSWAAMGIAYALGRIFGHVRLDRMLGAPPRLSGRPREDLAHVEENRPRTLDVLDLLARVRAPSFGRPLAAMGLLLPLTLHLVVWLLRGGAHSLEEMKHFDVWIRISAVYVGLAHLVVAVCGARFGKHFGGHLDTPEVGAASRGWTVVGFATLAACVPGILIIGIPPLLTAVTGAVIIPPAFHLAGKTLAAERDALASLRA
jgi:hypothetical protein